MAIVVEEIMVNTTIITNIGDEGFLVNSNVKKLYKAFLRQCRVVTRGGGIWSPTRCGTGFGRRCELACVNASDQHTPDTAGEALTHGLTPVELPLG